MRVVVFLLAADFDFEVVFLLAGFFFAGGFFVAAGLGVDERAVLREEFVGGELALADSGGEGVADDATARHLVHRLDRDTSGLIVVAKNDVAHRAMAAAFAERGVTVDYLFSGRPRAGCLLGPRLRAVAEMLPSSSSSG